jgi:MGT family glycosyltransferase
MPATGHTNPLKPVARALIGAGHTVAWYTGHKLREGVEATGATYLPMHADIDTPFDEIDARFPERAGLTGVKGMRWDLKHLFIDPVPQQVSDLTEFARGRRPDAVVADVAFLGASAYHELTGIAWISVGVAPLTVPSRDTAPFGTGLPPSSSPLGRVRNRLLYWLMDNVLLSDVGKHWQEVRGRLGLPPTDVQPMATISPLLHLQNGVEQFEYRRSDLPAQVHFVGSLAEEPDPTFEPPVWWDEVTSATRPVVHVTQGTVANGELDQLVTRTMRVLGQDDVLVVATTGGPDPATLGPVPANARVARFIPHSTLLPHTSAMVTNGGFGAVQKALAHAVPLVVAGVTEDKPEVAARVAHAGAGLRLRSAAPADDVLRKAIRRVLHEQAFRAGAERLRTAYAEVDTAGTLVRLIERVSI